MQDSVEQTGRKAVLAQYAQLAREERASNRELDKVMGPRDKDAVAEDNVINFLSAVGHAKAVQHLRVVEKMAVYQAQPAPDDREIDLLWSVRQLYEHLEKIGHAQQEVMENLEKGQGAKRRSKALNVLEYSMLREMQEDFRKTLAGLRLAEKRACYMQEIEMLDYQLDALLFLRELTDRLEAWRESLVP